jgi:hypothetical protein
MTDTWADLVWKALHDVNARLILLLEGSLAMATLVAIDLAGGWASARKWRS